MSGNKNLHNEAVEAVASEGGRLARGRPAVEHQQPALAAPAQRAPLRRANTVSHEHYYLIYGFIPKLRFYTQTTNTTIKTKDFPSNTSSPHLPHPRSVHP